MLKPNHTIFAEDYSCYQLIKKKRESILSFKLNLMRKAIAGMALLTASANMTVMFST